MRKVTRFLLAAIVLAISAVLLGIVPFNAGFIRGPIETAVRDATGLELSVSDRIILRLGPTPSVSSGGLIYGDPEGNPLLVIDSIHGRVRLFPLLRGRIHVRELTASGVRVDYCSPFPDVPGESNEDSAPPSIAVDAIELGSITIGCGPPAQADQLQIDIGQVLATAPVGEPMQLNAEGSLSGFDFTLSATGGELDRLLATPDRFPVRVSIESAGASAEVSGHLDSPATIDMQFEIRLSDVPSLSDAFDVALPAVGELSATGGIRSDFETLELIEVAGELGETLFGFDAAVDLTGERVHVGLTAMVERLHLAPFLDNGPSAQLPDRLAADDINLRPALSILGAFDAQVQLSVTRILGVPLDLGSVEFAANLSDGIVTLRSLEADVLDGRVLITGGLDSASECPELILHARGSDFDFATLNPMLALDQPLGGGADTVSIDVSSCGASLFAHRDALRVRASIAGVTASLDGETLPIVISEGTASMVPAERGRAHLIGAFANERLEATLAVGTLEALLGTDLWPLDLDARGAGSRLRVNGRARLAPEQMLVDARIRFDAPKFGTLHAWTGGAADTGLPLSAETRLRVDGSEMVADDITISLGSSDLGGRATWSYAQDPDLLAVRVRSRSVDVAEITTLLSPAPEHTDSATVQEEGDETPKPFVLPPVDLDLQISAIHAERLDIQDLSIVGRLRKGHIDEARVSLVVEDEVHLEGGLDLDVRQLPARGQLEFSAENLDIGRVLRRMEVVDDLLLRADALELLVTMQGSTPRQLVLNTLLQANLLGFNWKIPMSDTGDEAAAEDAFEVELEQVQLTTAPNQPTTWTSRGQVDGVGAELLMRAPSLNDIFSDIAELPLTLVAAAGDNVAMVDARFDRAIEDKLHARVTISGQVIAGDERALSELASPLEDYQFQSDVFLREKHLQRSEVKMRLGTSNAEGRLGIDASGPRRKFDVSLHAPYLQTDDLLYWSQDFRNAIPDDTEPHEGSIDTETEEIDTIDESAEDRGILFLVNDFLAEFREENDLAIRITVDELHAGSGLMGGGEIQLHVDETEFSLSPVTFNLPGGGVDAEYRTSVRDGRLDANLSVHADALSYGGLLRLVNHTSEARGLLYLDADIRANVEFPPGGIPMNLLFENAQGEIGFAAWPENIEAGVLDLWSANVVLAILPVPEPGEPSRLNCLVTRFDIEDGFMDSRTTLLDTTDTIIRGRGSIDLKNEQLDLLAWPQAKREKFFSVSAPVSITGPFDDFQIGVEPGGFIGTVIKWYTALIYVPFKWLTGERFEADGTSTCFDAMDWELTPELHDYFLQRDFSAPPSLP